VPTVPRGIRAQFVRRLRIVRERIFFDLWLQEKLERIDGDHLGYQVHFDRELRGGIQEDQASQIVGLRVLLPMQEVVCRDHL